MKRFYRNLCLVCLSLLIVPVIADELLEVTPFGAGSKWASFEEGGAVIARTGRSGVGFVVEGKGLDILSSECIGIEQANVEFERRITVRLVSVSGAAGGMAGIGLENDEIRVGGRMAYGADGTLTASLNSFGQLEPEVRVSGLSLPLWLRIDYQGGGFSMEYSADGVEWTAAAFMPITYPEAKFKLLSASGNEESSSCAYFDNVWMVAGDADENDLPDGWEMAHFGRLLGAEANADSDGDARTNTVEWLQRTNPRVPDLTPLLKVRLSTDGQKLEFWPNFLFSEGVFERSRDFKVWEAVPYSERNVNPNFEQPTFYRIRFLPPLDIFPDSF